VSRTGRLVVYASCGSGRGVAFAFTKVSHAMDSPPPSSFSRDSATWRRPCSCCCAYVRVHRAMLTEIHRQELITISEAHSDSDTAAAAFS
jgi:hypothetical protein